MKLCRDCKYFTPSLVDTQCQHPSNPRTVDYVTGESRAQWKGATIVRTVGDLCGPEARWFEPKAVEQEAA